METKTKETPITGKQKTLLIIRTFDMSIQNMWKAWSEAEIFRKWWGPEGFTCTFCILDFRIGGKTIASMKSADGQEYWTTFTYREITPLKKIVYEDSFADSAGNPVPPSYYNMPGEWREVKVILTFEEAGNKMKMMLQHEDIPEEMQEDCRTGWQQSFDKLEKNLK